MAAPSNQVYQNGLVQVSGDQLNTFVQGGATLATLRAFIGVSGMNVQMIGFTTANDGGQGAFYWNASGSAADDGGVTTIVPYGTASGEWSRLNISGSSTGRIITATGTVTMINTDGIVEINKTTPANTVVTLPTSPFAFRIYTIKDGAGNAYTYPITVTPPSGNIDGSATYVMNINWQAQGFYFNNTNWRIVN